MKAMTSRIALLTLAAFALTSHSPVRGAAPEPASQRWYNVELMVFSRTDPSAAESEAWPPLPDLSYPAEFRFLKYPETATAEAPVPLVGTNDGRETMAEDPNQGAQDPNQFLQAPEKLRPQPFVRLDKEQWEFRQRADRMQRSGRYDIHFHESWNQPIVSRENTLPIMLDQSGYLRDWPKLQGSITLYLSRYLHLETNLWLNTTGSYFPDDWQMPAPPLGPGPVNITEQVNEESVVDKEIFDNGSDAAVGDAATFTQFAPKEDEPTLGSGPIYPWRHAVVLQQRRKMRSQEVHYIDHPMMGVIVLVTPLSEEDLELLALEERGLDPNQPR